MSLISSCSCLCAIYWNQVLSREWRCSWSSADRRCSKYIWVVNNVILYYRSDGRHIVWLHFVMYFCVEVMVKLNISLQWLHIIVCQITTNFTVCSTIFSDIKNSSGLPSQKASNMENVPMSWIINHYSDVIMSMMACKNHQPHDCLLNHLFTSGTDQRKHQSSMSVASVQEIHHCDQWIPLTNGQ